MTTQIRADTVGLTSTHSSNLLRRRRHGLWLGLLGVTIFALTLPMTRIAGGTPDVPQMSGVFIAAARAALAGTLSIVFLLATRAPQLQLKQFKPLALVALGVVFGFPLCTSIAMRHVEATHAGVVVGVLPLITAAIGAWLHRQRHSVGFWICAGAGTALVVGFALLRSDASSLAISAADALLLLAVACAAIGYAYGAQLSQSMRAEHVICWALVLSLPVSVPLTMAQWPQSAIKIEAWWALAYVSVFSMWLGFFGWYKGLAMGGTVRVSQVQLVQPFLTMVFAVPLLGETLDAPTLGFGLAVVATVFIGKRF
jgi:drug/metabolite transporter (DMT)-like permease